MIYRLIESTESTDDLHGSKKETERFGRHFGFQGDDYEALKAERSQRLWKALEAGSKSSDVLVELVDASDFLPRISLRSQGPQTVQLWRFQASQILQQATVPQTPGPSAPYRFQMKVLDAPKHLKAIAMEGLLQRDGPFTGSV